MSALGINPNKWHRLLVHGSGPEHREYPSHDLFTVWHRRLPHILPHPQGELHDLFKIPRGGFAGSLFLVSGILKSVILKSVILKSVVLKLLIIKWLSIYLYFKFYLLHNNFIWICYKNSPFLFLY